MKAVEFESTLSPGGQISLPPGIATGIPVGEHLRIVVMWEPSAGTDPEWVLAGRQAFESAYSPEDAVYEQLLNDTPPR